MSFLFQNRTARLAAKEKKASRERQIRAHINFQDERDAVISQTCEARELLDPVITRKQADIITRDCEKMYPGDVDKQKACYDNQACAITAPGARPYTGKYFESADAVHEDSSCCKVRMSSRLKRAMLTYRLVKLAGGLQPGDFQDLINSLHVRGVDFQNNEVVTQILDEQKALREIAARKFEELQQTKAEWEARATESCIKQILNMTKTKLLGYVGLFVDMDDEKINNSWVTKLGLKAGTGGVAIFKVLNTFVLKDPRMVHFLSIILILLRKRFCTYLSLRAGYEQKSTYLPDMSDLWEFKGIYLTDAFEKFISTDFHPFMGSLTGMLTSLITTIASSGMSVVAGAAGAISNLAPMAAVAASAGGPFMWVAGMAAAGTAAVATMMSTVGAALGPLIIESAKLIFSILSETIQELSKLVIVAAHLGQTYSNITRLFTDPCLENQTKFDPLGALSDTMKDAVGPIAAEASELANSAKAWGMSLLTPSDDSEAERDSKKVKLAEETINRVLAPQMNLPLFFGGTAVDPNLMTRETYQTLGPWYTGYSTEIRELNKV
jgi:predicted TIM-barrel fold metal-dependent hydrolase